MKQAIACALIEARVERAFDPNVKKQKRALEADIIATALPRGVIPDPLFQSLWYKSTETVTQLLAEEKPSPELLSSNLRIMSHLKNLNQAVSTETIDHVSSFHVLVYFIKAEVKLDPELGSKLAAMTTKMRKRLHKSGQKALRTFVKCKFRF